MAQKFFGTDGVRGRANGTKMNSETAMRIGSAAGRHVRPQGGGRVVIGKDTRLSSDMLESALVAGFTSVGMDVLQLGALPTPAVAGLTQSMRADLGVMIAPSPNMFDDNGIKLFGPDGLHLNTAVDHHIKEMLDEPFGENSAELTQIGRARRVESAQQRYVEKVKRAWPSHLSLKGVRVVVDCANGAAYHVAPQVLWELGADVVEIGCEPDGTNINVNCGAANLQGLANAVRVRRADIGIALDGGADRVTIVDETGQIVDGDQLLAVITDQFQSAGQLRGNTIVTSLMSNMGFERHLQTLGLKLQRTNIGDRYVLEGMHHFGANVGGEQSGHIILSDYATTGDGLVAALQIMAAFVASKERRMSEICQCFDPVPQVLHHLACHQPDVLVQDGVQGAIKEARTILGGVGRILVRPSGTEPLIRIMAEHDDASIAEIAIQKVIQSIDRYTIAVAEPSAVQHPPMCKNRPRNSSHQLPSRLEVVA